ncbi:MAG: (2Fe-2S)-binding protein [Gammaproteobacteria bacterium]|nr:(2Fe-2S)-binding protein [Gammaproteobacteria bacterium]MCP5424160.1 (2Fe-2S)-binding protein [Gammaproteobacteria bacterium]
MYICICKAVTDRQIHQAIQDGHVRMRDLRRELGVCTGCGKCAPQIHAMIRAEDQETADTFAYVLNPAPAC